MATFELVSSSASSVIKDWEGKEAWRGLTKCCLSGENNLIWDVLDNVFLLSIVLI